MKRLYYYFLFSLLLSSIIVSCTISRKSLYPIDLNIKEIRQFEKKLYNSFQESPYYNSKEDYHTFYLFNLEYHNRFCKKDFLDGSFITYLSFKRNLIIHEPKRFIQNCYRLYYISLFILLCILCTLLFTLTK